MRARNQLTKMMTDVQRRYEKKKENKPTRGNMNRVRPTATSKTAIPPLKLTTNASYIKNKKEIGFCQQLCALVGGVDFCVSSALVVRSLSLPRFFSHGVLMLIFLVHPCLFASRALELMSAQFLPLILM